MKVYTSVVMRIADWEILDEESYEYAGPIAHCGGDGDGGGGGGEDPGGLESYYGGTYSGYGNAPGVQGTSGVDYATGQAPQAAAAPPAQTFVDHAMGKTAKAGATLGGVAGPAGAILGGVGGALYDIGGAQMQEHGITGADLAASEAEAAGMGGEATSSDYPGGVPPGGQQYASRTVGQAPAPAAPLPPVAPPKPFDPIPAEVVTNEQRGTLGSTPNEIDEANRLRRERQSKFAESRASDESRMLSELVGGYGDTDRLRKDRTARQMFLGIPGVIAGYRR